MVPKTWRWSATSPSIWSAKSSTSDQSSAAASVPPGTRNTCWTLSARCSQSRVNLDSLPCLVIDQVGYLSYSNRHADLLFELISRRYEHKSTLVTTNRPFAEWRDVFPTAACVASLIDRLVHHAEIIAIDGESYRLKEATERSEKRRRQRRGAKS